MVPVSYSYRSLLVRWKTTLMTAAAFTLVIAALIVMLSFVNGIQQICRTTGEPENIVVLNEGASDEVLSTLPLTTAHLIENSQGVARDPKGRPMASRELFMSAQVFDLDVNDYVTYSLRGVEPIAYDVHPTVRITSGRALRPSQSEIIIGRTVANNRGLDIGDSVEIGRKTWTVCGIFDAGGSTFDSEVWCDLDELASQFRRGGGYSSVVLRALSPGVAESLARRLDENRQFSVTAATEVDYYAKQGESTEAIRDASWGIAFIMGTGAVFGIMNTMFAAISQRIKDIAILRLLGFMPRDILISFLIEAVLIALIGGVLGTMVGGIINSFVNLWTQNWQIGGHEVSFSFSVDASMLIVAAVFAAIMGIAGGLFPAMSAMRVKPIEAFR